MPSGKRLRRPVHTPACCVGNTGETPPVAGGLGRRLLERRLPAGWRTVRGPVLVEHAAGGWRTHRSPLAAVAERKDETASHGVHRGHRGENPLCAPGGPCGRLRVSRYPTDRPWPAGSQRSTLHQRTAV